MAQVKISELDAVTTLTDNDVLPIVNGDDTKKVTLLQLKNEISGGSTDIPMYFIDESNWDTPENLVLFKSLYQKWQDGEPFYLQWGEKVFSGIYNQLGDIRFTFTNNNVVNGVRLNGAWYDRVQDGYITLDLTNDTLNGYLGEHILLRYINGNSYPLSSDNTTAYAVSSDYVPAHKKYVDDSISSAVGSINTVLATLTTVGGGE